MKILFSSWVIAFLAIILFDIIWFSLTVEKFYKPNLHNVISNNFKYDIAAIFYIIYSFAASYLIIAPYSAYNLTNQATIENWPVIVTVVDTFWGGLVTALVSASSYYVVNYFN